MSYLPARKGRHRQRYTDHLRLVAGCIPYRLENDTEESRISVLMISTPNRDDLVFPKGGWEDDETVHEAACREALEEAGVKGILDVGGSTGVWEFRSKSKQNSCSLEGGCRGYMFALEVTEELDSWAEQITYNRKWVSPEEAYKLCRYDWMREALGVLLRGMKRRQQQQQMLPAGCSANPSNLEESLQISVLSRLMTSTPSTRQVL
ncbi:nudix hydrolase 13, mitochondrial-like [Hibiscus syriacus]|uniref:nudix hydrolase 13, mitochondrial-like n=1 Tax=Hibiscus syriacus TaxID=106335 RepID=UPI001920EB50|nr:nudix hydrolase 13, mitochondrial-like [Hibiscus syriacus]